MLIVCPSCASEYALDPERIGERGRKVRCAACRTTWVARGPEATPDRPADDVVRVASGDGPGRAAPATIEALPERSQKTPAASRGRASAARGRSDRSTNVLACAAIVVLISGAGAAIGLREPLVRHVPSSASLFALAGLRVNLVGLELGDVSALVGEENGAPVLFVEGEIRSKAPVTVPVPRLEFTIETRSSDQLYRWSVKAPVVELDGGRSARFATRLASPPPTADRLVASFQGTRGDPSVALR